MKDKEYKQALNVDVSPEDLESRKKKKGKKPVTCEIDESGRATCCGPGDLSHIKPVPAKRGK